MEAVASGKEDIINLYRIKIKFRLGLNWTWIKCADCQPTYQ